MKKLIIFIIAFLWSVSSIAAIVVRQHSATIQPDMKILASDLNDEFNNLVTGVNTIDSTNVVGGSLTQTNFAATSTAVSLNKRSGCSIGTQTDGSGTKLVAIFPPCEIYMDGVRGFITATQTISLLSNILDGGALGFSQFYYVYAAMNNGSLSFSFSQIPPYLYNARKTGNTAYRYIGSVRTQDATSDIAGFQQTGNHYYWSGLANTIPSKNMIATGNSIDGVYNLSVPTFWNRLQLKYQSYVTGFPAQCEYQFSGPGLAGNGNFQSVVEATAGHTGVVPFDIIPGQSGGLASIEYQINNIKNCWVGGDLRVIGWEEPSIFYQ